MKISKRIIKEKNKIVYRHLIKLVVKCPEENCDWKGIFKEYFEHLKNNHYKKTETNCINTDTKYELYKYYKAITHNHPLKYLDTTMDNGWACNGINLPRGCLSGTNGFFQTKNIKRFRCMQCDYDLCEKCMDFFYDDKYPIKNNEPNIRNLYLFEKKYNSQIHEHPLIFLDKSQDNGWACNGRFFIYKCLSGITCFHQTGGIPRFRCEQCNFDLCENCMNYYRKKIFYEINKVYKASCHLHELKFVGNETEDAWFCDGMKLAEKCLSLFNSFSQTKGFDRFKCEECNFNLCKNCMDFYFIEKNDSI